MTRFTHPEDLGDATFTDVSLRGARFTRCDLSGVVMRAVEVEEADIDAPWLGTLRVNGVDVAPFVDAELNRRFPGRAERRAGDPAGLRSAWGAVERTWAGTIARVAAMAPGTEAVSVDEEWSFAQTLRHLIMATDTWFVGAVQEIDKPYHRIGLPNAEYESDGYDPSVFRTDEPPYDEVLAVRAQRVAMVRDFLASLTADDLTVPRRHPWSPEHRVSTLSCLHTILTEEWEHHRYATRDLDAIASGRG